MAIKNKFACLDDDPAPAESAALPQPAATGEKDRLSRIAEETKRLAWEYGGEPPAPGSIAARRLEIEADIYGMAEALEREHGAAVYAALMEVSERYAALLDDAAAAERAGRASGTAPASPGAALGECWVKREPPGIVRRFLVWLVLGWKWNDGGVSRKPIRPEIVSPFG